jgi:hypothetical protein
MGYFASRAFYRSPSNGVQSINLKIITKFFIAITKNTLKPSFIERKEHGKFQSGFCINNFWIAEKSAVHYLWGRNSTIFHRVLPAVQKAAKDCTERRDEWCCRLCTLF